MPRVFTPSSLFLWKQSQDKYNSKTLSPLQFENELSLHFPRDVDVFFRPFPPPPILEYSAFLSNFFRPDWKIKAWTELLFCAVTTKSSTAFSGNMLVATNHSQTRLINYWAIWWQNSGPDAMFFFLKAHFAPIGLNKNCQKVFFSKKFAIFFHSPPKNIWQLLSRK